MSSAAQAVVRTKSPEAFRTISEASVELEVPQHVLRFWETRFAQIRPVKRAGGRRFYRPEDIDLLRGIRVLLYFEGYTIKGVQKVLRDRGIRHVATLGRGDATSHPEGFAVNADMPDDSDAPLLAVSAHVPADAEQPLEEEARAKLQRLLTELLQLKSRLRLARPRIA